jgi:hypothetical protein
LPVRHRSADFASRPSGCLRQYWMCHVERRSLHHKRGVKTYIRRQRLG